jgi:hypothetical protein
LKKFDGLVNLQLTVQGLPKYGSLKNFSLAFILMMIKDNVLQTFSKAPISANRCAAALFV